MASVESPKHLSTAGGRKPKWEQVPIPRIRKDECVLFRAMQTAHRNVDRSIFLVPHWTASASAEFAIRALHQNFIGQLTYLEMFGDP
jgi:hypothetical protein